MASMSEIVAREERIHLFFSRGLLGLCLMLAALAAGAIYFRAGIAALFEVWSLPEYSHGPLIPVLSSLLFLRQLKTLPPQAGPIGGRWPGVLVVLGALTLGALGQIAGIDDIVAYALIVFIAGLILVSLGWRRGRHFWPAVLHLVFMLPLPGILYWKVSSSLQLFSSQVGVQLIQMAGIPVFLDGNIIDLGVYKLHVAEACSGLRYLYPIMSFSYIFSALYRGPVWHKAVLLLSAAPITVLMNSMRIGLIGVMVDAYGIEQAEGFTHLLEGWVIFLAAVVILFGLVSVMLRLSRSRMTLSEALDLDFSGIGSQLERARLIRPSSALFAILALTAGAVVAWEAVPRSEPLAIEREPFTLFPTRIGGWTRGLPQSLDPSIERTLGADDYFGATFTSLEARAPVDFFSAWYRDQTKGGIHSPEVCLPGGGWEMARIERVESDLGGPGESFPINRAIIQKGEERLLVYYWFEQFGGRTASDYLAKAVLLRDGLLYGRTDGALVRIITPILRSETLAEAEARLRDFAVPAVEVLPRFIPIKARPGAQAA